MATIPVSSINHRIDRQGAWIISLYRRTGVSVESYVEMARGVAVRCEVDRLNEQASLAFGSSESFVLSLDRDALEQLVSLGSRAIVELDVEGEPLTVM
ncbi:hypothetical protein [Actinopolyspora mzabensis]|uniref:hypothetical protein n=1 Tax=Actinopolyspora mzabensis TaxID=995066 RepID=UPI00115FAB7C|nr:hypothetical protein [Actinopolyspora mzabensis]